LSVQVEQAFLLPMQSYGDRMGSRLSRLILAMDGARGVSPGLVHSSALA
jgi:hypothetical protein